MAGICQLAGMDDAHLSYGIPEQLLHVAFGHAIDIETDDESVVMLRVITAAGEELEGGLAIDQAINLMESLEHHILICLQADGKIDVPDHPPDDL